MHPKKTFLIMASLLAMWSVISLACNMPSTITTNVPPNAATAETASNAATTPSAPTAPPRATMVVAPTQQAPSGNLPPTPTQAHPAAPSGSNDTAPPVLSNVRSTAKAYYQPGCGSTTIAFAVDATDNTGVTRVWVSYQFISLAVQGGLGGTQWFQIPLQKIAGNHYEGTLDLTQQAPAELQGHDGTMQYQIYAQDATGNVAVDPDGYVYGAEALGCGQNGGAGNNGGNTTLSVDNITIYPQGEIYYGRCSTEETMMNVQARLEPMNKISVAEVRYAYSNAAGFQGGYTATMSQLGIGDYAADINVGAEANAALNGADGQVEYYIHVETNDGQVLETNWATFPVRVCQGNAGNPPRGSTPNIRYFNGPTTITPGDTVVLEWDVQDACKVFLDGNEVNANDVYTYTVPSNEGDTTYTHVLTVWGSSCDNTNEQNAVVTIQVSNGNNGGGGNGGGNGGGGGNNTSVVRFYNQASHPVVELIIDGQDVILTEAQSIPVGGYLDVNVTDGTHNYQAGVGFWQGGTKTAIHPLPAGSFNIQGSAVVTVSDPSLGEMLTNYGNGGYYAGTYWDDNALVHCAAFDFNASGRFDFYLDGQYDESGSYTLISRDPSTYSVVFRVTGDTSGEQFDGTFFYTGALASTIQMDNGPASWRTIEYVLNGTCP